MTTNNIGSFAKTKLLQTIASHCSRNEGVIHDTDLDRYINNLRESSDAYKDASITDLFTANGDDQYDTIERAQTDSRTPSEYWQLTEYGNKCINPTSWLK